MKFLSKRETKKDGSELYLLAVEFTPEEIAAAEKWMSRIPQLKMSKGAMHWVMGVGPLYGPHVEVNSVSEIIRQAHLLSKRSGQVRRKRKRGRDNGQI